MDVDTKRECRGGCARRSTERRRSSPATIRRSPCLLPPQRPPASPHPRSLSGCERGAPVYVLGNGPMVVAGQPQPRGPATIFVQGGLDDLLRLPVLPGAGRGCWCEARARAEDAPPPRRSRTLSRSAAATPELFRFCMKKALTVGSFAELPDAARNFNPDLLRTPDGV